MAEDARRYTDEEVRDILGRASALETRPALPPGGSGMSLAEIEAAAVEAGIEPGAVRRAALSTLPPAHASFGARLAGGPARRRHGLVVPGRLPTDRGARRELERALETVLERELEVEDGGGYLVFEEDHRQGRTRIELREVEEGVELTLDADRAGWVTLAGLASAAVVGGLAVPLGAFFLGTLNAPLLFAAVCVALTVAGIRLAWAPASRRLHAKLEEAASEVVARLEPAGGQPPDESGGSAKR